ncbi:MAG: hypothetical protein VB862_17170 [Pirellulaceae bacterium]
MPTRTSFTSLTDPKPLGLDDESMGKLLLGRTGVTGACFVVAAGAPPTAGAEPFG